MSIRVYFLLAAVHWGCAKTQAPAAATVPRDPVAAVPESLKVKVVRSFPHDPAAFTQGLLFFEGKLFESTGLPGRSSIRQVDLESGEVTQRVALDSPLFGEGLTRVGDRLIQLTWQDGRALVWGLRTLQKVSEYRYEGEGWGLCFDGKRLVMSDGSDRLTFRDPDSFAVLGTLQVSRQGQPVSHLNELECVGTVVYANIWQDNHIARIDGQTGSVTGWIDARGLLTAEQSVGVDVLNGIAYVAETGRFLVTGKLWPRVFEVAFVRP